MIGGSTCCLGGSRHISLAEGVSRRQEDHGSIQSPPESYAFVGEKSTSTLLDYHPLGVFPRALGSIDVESSGVSSLPGEGGCPG